MRVGMLTMSDVSADARVRREAAALAEAGHDVVVASLALARPDAAPEGVEVVEVSARSPFPRVAAGAPAWRRAARWLLVDVHHRRLLTTYLERATRALAASGVGVVHAHDFDTLPAATDLAKRLGARLVYDSHEVWSARRPLGRPTPVRRRRELVAERRLGAHADAVVTVGQGVADHLRATFGWEHVRVVRNSFPYAGGPAPSAASALLYAGRIGRGRELEVLAKAARDLEVDVIAIGPVDEAFARRLQGVRIEPAVAIDEVPVRLHGAGLAFIGVADGPLNHRLALPNKLFQAVQAGVPVIAPDLPELRRVVQEHGLGGLYRPGDPVALTTAVNRVLADYAGFTGRVVAARRALSWEQDRAVLVGLYEELATEAARSRPSPS